MHPSYLPLSSYLPISLIYGCQSQKADQGLVEITLSIGKDTSLFTVPIVSEEEIDGKAK